jgi:hypothetical protein
MYKGPILLPADRHVILYYLDTLFSRKVGEPQRSRFNQHSYLLNQKTTKTPRNESRCLCGLIILLTLSRRNTSDLSR